MDRNIPVPYFQEVIKLFTSIILAWLAVLFTALSAVLFIAKRSGSKRLRRIFSRIHIGVGVLLIVAGVVHGVLAGNAQGATLSDMMVAPLLFTWNWGTACLAAAVMLAASYMVRKLLKKRWMKLHRVLTVVLIALVIVHVGDVGVQAFDRIVPVSYAEAAAEETPIETDEDSGMDTAALIDGANALFSGAALTDGVYEGSASGYSGEITVSVTVLDGRVTEIEVLSESDTPQYFCRAETVIDTILEEQTLAVDAVSGATYSSAGIVNAVNDALSAAVGSGALEVTEYTYTNRHGGRGH